MERVPDLQGRIDAARRPWLLRRGLLAGAVVVVLVSLTGAIPGHLIWSVGSLIGILLTEAELYLVRSARTVRDFELRVTVVRLLVVASTGFVVTLIIGSSWVVPVGLAMMLAASATQLSERRTLAVLATGSMSYLVGTTLIGTGAVDPIAPLGLSGSISGPAALAIATLVMPAVTVFAFSRSRRADAAHVELVRTVEVLRTTQAQVRAAHLAADGTSQRLAAEVERTTEELARRNRALSVVNAISFALNEPLEDDAALRRAAQLVARLLGVDAVQVRQLPTGAEPYTDIVVGAGQETEEPPGLPAAMIDAAIDLRNGVRRSWDDDADDSDRCYVIVPMVTQATVRGSLTLIGEACRDWGEQELHLLTLIGREIGAALESARLYRAALTRADRERLVTEVSSLLGSATPLHEQLDQIVAKTGEEFGAVFASVTSIDGDIVGPELARWEPDGPPFLDAEQLNALTALIPRDLGAAKATRVLAPPSVAEFNLRERCGDLVVIPIFTAQTVSLTAVDDRLPDAGDRSNRAPGAVLMLAAPAGGGWSHADLEVLPRLANSIGRRLEREQLVQLQHRRFEEMAVLAEIGRLTQSGVDVDRLYSDFVAALYRLVPYERAYIARTSEGVLTDVVGFSGGGRVAGRLDLHKPDASHTWFNARESVAWSSSTTALPRFMGDEAGTGLTFPMRPKGQAFGAVVLVSTDAPLVSSSFVERAVEQLAMALDSAELYRQATERASRIEAHKNLASIVASAIDLRGAFDAFSEEIRWLIPFERSVLLSVDNTTADAEQLAIYPPIDGRELITASVAGSILASVLEADGALALTRSDEQLARLDWRLFGADAAEVAAVPVMQDGEVIAIFALISSGVADYEKFDLRALEEVAGLLAVTIDRLRLYERAEHAARHDMLTGLPNYRNLQERLATIQTEFEDDRRAAVLMVDMDGLKLYNDTLGHEAGDRAIQRVAEELKNAVRDEDLIARTGGDEFVVVMESVSEEDALIVAQRMHDSLRDIHREFGNAPVPVRISVGLAFAPDDGTTPSELIEAADRAMYAAKFSGGDRTRAAGGEQERGNTPRTLRRRGNRVMELLIRTAVDGASGSERLATALAQRYVVAVALGQGLAVDTADPLRMLVAAEAAHHIEAPEAYRDQETALMLLDGLRTQWEAQVDSPEFQLSQLLPAAVRLAWEQIPAPDGPGLTAEQALAVVINDPAYDLTPGVVELLSQSALTAEFERRRMRNDAA